MIRCPSCAVSWKLPLTKNHSLFVAKDMTHVTLEREPISFFSKVATMETLEEVAEAFQKHDIDFIDAVNIPCPNCHQKHTFEKWVETFERPGDYFEGTNLCTCGGELWWDRLPHMPRYALVCDKCKWIQPGKTLSGAPD